MLCVLGFVLTRFTVPLCGKHFRSTYLNAQLAGHVAKWVQLLCVFGDALHVVVAELVLGVDQGEHQLHQAGPEV